MMKNEEQIEAGAKIVAEWLRHDWDGLGSRDISGDYPDFACIPHFNGGQPALRKLVSRVLAAALSTQPQAGEPVAWVRSKFGDPAAFGEREIEADEKLIQKLPYNTPLYAAPPTASEPKTYPVEYDLLPDLRRIADALGDRDHHLLMSAILEIIELRALVYPAASEPVAVKADTALLCYECDGPLNGPYCPACAAPEVLIASSEIWKLLQMSSMNGILDEEHLPKLARDIAQLADRSVSPALPSRGELEEDGWRPIDTAPKDGTEILIWIAEPWSKVEKARWYQPWGNWQSGAIPDDPVREELYGIGSSLPTHWMPVPSRPAALGSRRNG
jgi:hypothetical protein